MHTSAPESALSGGPAPKPAAVGDELQTCCLAPYLDPSALLWGAAAPSAAFGWLWSPDHLLESNTGKRELLSTSIVIQRLKIHKRITVYCLLSFKTKKNPNSDFRRRGLGISYLRSLHSWERWLLISWTIMGAICSTSYHSTFNYVLNSEKGFFKNVKLTYISNTVVLNFLFRSVICWFILQQFNVIVHYCVRENPCIHGKSIHTERPQVKIKRGSPHHTMEGVSSSRTFFNITSSFFLL